MYASDLYSILKWFFDGGFVSNDKFFMLDFKQ